jgi:thiamine biosynthesis lipoprotein
MVEVGGEVKTKGINDKGSVWVLGITKPSSNANLEDVILPVKLPNKAMATSGNYRQFYSNGELTFAHIINTKNGQSEPTDILSATVIAEDCETADAFATAFMALGKEKAIHLSEKVKFIETCFIYNDVNSDSLAYYFSPGFEIYRK